jgi:hypothetical protein
MHTFVQKTGSKCVTQIVSAQVFDSSSRASRREPFLNSLYGLTVAVGEKPLSRRRIFDESPILWQSVSMF